MTTQGNGERVRLGIAACLGVIVVTAGITAKRSTSLGLVLAALMVIAGILTRISPYVPLAGGVTSLLGAVLLQTQGAHAGAKALGVAAAALFIMSAGLAVTAVPDLARKIDRLAGSVARKLAALQPVARVAVALGVVVAVIALVVWLLGAFGIALLITSVVVAMTWGTKRKATPTFLWWGLVALLATSIATIADTDGLRVDLATIAFVLLFGGVATALVKTLREDRRSLRQ